MKEAMFVPLQATPQGAKGDLRGGKVYAPTPEPDSFGRPMFSVGGYASTSALVSLHH